MSAMSNVPTPRGSAAQSVCAGLVLLCADLGSAHAQSMLTSTLAIARDAASRVLSTPAGRSSPRGVSPLLGDEVGSAGAIARLAELSGMALPPRTERVFLTIPSESSDSVARCAEMPLTAGHACQALAPRQLISIHGALTRDAKTLVVRIKVLSWTGAEKQPSWHIGEVEYVRGRAGQWVFSKFGQFYTN